MKYVLITIIAILLNSMTGIINEMYPILNEDLIVIYFSYIFLISLMVHNEKNKINYNFLLILLFIILILYGIIYAMYWPTYVIILMPASIIYKKIFNNPEVHDVVEVILYNFIYIYILSCIIILFNIIFTPYVLLWEDILQSTLWITFYNGILLTLVYYIIYKFY